MTAFIIYFLNGQPLWVCNKTYFDRSTIIISSEFVSVVIRIYWLAMAGVTNFKINRQYLNARDMEQKET